MLETIYFWKNHKPEIDYRIISENQPVADYFDLSKVSKIDISRYMFNSVTWIISYFEEIIRHNYDDNIQQFEDKQREIYSAEQEKSELEEKLSNPAKTIINSSLVFRHLRNSVFHGRYNIDLLPGLTKKDLDQSIVTFWDFDEKTNMCNFKIQMKAETLIRIMIEISNRMRDYNIKYEEEYYENKVRAK